MVTGRSRLALVAALAFASALPVSCAAVQAAPDIASSVPAGDRLMATLARRVFPLLVRFDADDGVARALRADFALVALAGSRAERVSAAAKCAPAPVCLIDARLWTPAEIETVAATLRRLAATAPFAKLAGEMRASGEFARHARQDDAALLAAAWTEAAAGMNRVLDVYGKGVPPRYPKIDSIVHDLADPKFAQLVAITAATQDALARPGEAVHAAPLRFTLALLDMNDRIDAAAYVPLAAHGNARPRGIDWRRYRYTAILVPGFGPEDPITRLGAPARLRLQLAADRFAQGVAPLIIVSGGNVHPNRTPYNEAVEMRQSLVTRFGIPAARILIDPHARHTTTNLRNAARIAFALDLPPDRDMLILTDPTQSAYIESPVFAARNLEEMGYQPGILGPRLSPFEMAFRPSPVSRHVDPRDPLDP